MGGVHEDPTTITKILILLREMLVGLCCNSGRLISKGYLVQIWIVAGGTVLLAKDSLYDIDANEEAFSSQLQRYRAESTKNEIAIDMKNPGFLQYEVAKRCGIQGSKLLPVFSLDSPDSCVAVIELVTAAPDTDFGIKELIEIQRHLEKVGLTTTNDVGYLFSAQHGSSLVRSSWKGKEVQSNSDSQFYVGSPSLDDKTPIVSARLKNPRRIRIFRFKSAFTIEELKRRVRNEFNWDDNAGIKFDLHSVNLQNERVVLIQNDQHVRELFGTHFVVIIMDVQLHEGAPASTKRNKIGRRRDGDTRRRGVELDINGDGYKMAYEAIDSVCKPGDRDKMMQNIIDASPSKVKALRIEYCSPPSLDQDGRQKKIRRGESNSTLDETQHYSGGPRNMTSVLEKTQDILMSAETTEQQLQQSNVEVINVEKSRAERDYVAPPVSTSQMEENLSNMELLVSPVNTQGILSAETTEGEEETTAHRAYVEPAAVSASLMEENDDIRVGVGVDNQLVFSYGNGREFDASDHDRIGDISSTTTAAQGAYVEPAAVSASHMEENIHVEENECPAAGVLGDYGSDWSFVGDIGFPNNDFGWDAVELPNDDLVLGYEIWD